MEPLTLTRSAHLDADLGRVWAALARPEGLAGWLADSVDVEVERGAAGTVSAGGAVRRIVVTEVDEGRQLGFTWWDEADPAQASTVRIAVEADGEGGTTVRVTETLDPAAAPVAGGRSSTLLDASIDGPGVADDAWTDRLARLLGVVAPAVVAGA